MEIVPRIAHLEQDGEPDVSTDALLSPRQAWFRWACDRCWGRRRSWHGRWHGGGGGEAIANDAADAHDRMHTRRAFP